MGAKEEKAINTKVEISGEREYKQACAQINTALSGTASEMRLLSAEYKGNEKSTKALKGQQELLQKRLEEQKNKVKAAEAMMKQYEKDGVKKTSKAVQDLQIELNDAKTAMTKTENALKANSEALKKSKLDWSALGETVGSVAKGIGTGIATVTAAAAALAVKVGKDVVSSFGELEQNLGGSEAVFGDYALAIQRAGEDAYKNLGVSQSEYLATANKMGALFQGSGVEQQRSLELTEQAMQRAADMASVMGIETSSAMEAVAGAAKGNYTMMDNLGVSMNDTTLKAYMLSSGMAKNTRAANRMWQSMSQADKAELAMQMFFDKTEQYAGNFARESTETISGSFGMLQASVTALTGGLGNSTADIAHLAANVVSAFTAVIHNVTPVIQNLAKSLPTAIRSAMSGMKEAAPELVSAATTLFTEMLSSLSEMLPIVASMGMEIISSVVQGITSQIPAIAAAAVSIVESLISGIVEMLPSLADGALQIVAALAGGIGQALPELVPQIVNMLLLIGQTIADNLPLLIEAALQLVVGLANGIVAAIPELITAIPTMIAAIVEALVASLPALVEAAIQIVAGIIANFPTIIAALIAYIPSVISSIVETFKAFDWGQMWSGISETFLSIDWAGMWETAKTAFSNAWETIKAIFGITPDFLASLSEIGGNIVSGIWDGISSWAETLKENVTGFFGGIVESVKNFLGIHSPSTVFAEIGGNMAAGVGTGFGDEMSGVEGDMTGAVSGVGDATAVSAVEAVNAGILANITALDTGINAIVDGVTLGLAAQATNLQTTGSDMDKSIGEGMVSGSVLITQKMPQIVGSMAAALNAEWSQFYYIGQNMARGIWDGFADMKGWLDTQVTSYMRKLVQKVKNEMKIQSPSRVFAEIGAFMAEGLGVGFEKQMDGVQERIAQAVNQTIPATGGSRQNETVYREERQRQGTTVAVNQYFYTSETDYAKQQREAAKNFRQIAREVML